MRKILLVLVFIFGVLGCSDKKIIVHEPLKNELLAYTSKAEIINDTNRTLIIATYLNPIYQSKISIKGEEKFLVAISPKENEIDASSVKVNNESNATSLRLLDKNDELLSLAGFNMPWAAYYEISAPSKSSDKLNLTFEIYPSQKVSLEFQKVAKSLYWNP
ncbi:hypothetical protein [Campylobacter curvus]|uniref:hypothetical protein n=1 Tax=Campylobacter curvus TaxID=200 RepID=UPI0003765163|nr:hypothetical protein [Campylobacter curvus]QKF60944.1 hypothetical protein CCVT_0636 [Campylobacter curvus]UEB49262.1 hypothetical protein LK426_06435 [Campylobacter curvus]